MATPILESLRSLELHHGQLALVPLGQASFALRAADRIVLIDPFLSEYPGRLIPPSFSPADATGVDLVLITHDHADHLDGEAVRGISAASPQARIVVPAPIVPRIRALGVERERVTGMRSGNRREFGGIAVYAIPAQHAVDAADGYSFGEERYDGQVGFLGYVLEAAGVALYHSGDTLLYRGMADGLRPFAVDVALLPINGRDAEREARNIAGNMDHAEAAELAAAIGARMVVPMHYDMFERNPGYPERLVEIVRTQYPELTVVVPARDQVFVVSRA